MDAQAQIDESSSYLLEAIDIHKHFGGVYALKGVDLRVARSEIHGLVGENGAGKSTLTKIICGYEQPDSGELRLNQQTVRFSNPDAAMAHGIATVYQEMSLFPLRTAAQNVMCRQEPRTASGLINWAKVKREAARILSQIGADIPPNALVADLSVANQQVVEIAKALSRNPSLLILDEPTSALAKDEIARLFELLRKLKQTGITIIFISHKLDEILEICDHITVLRDGAVTGNLCARETKIDAVIQLMVGRKLDAFFPDKAAHPGGELLCVRNFSRAGQFQNIGFELCRGEILGMFGLIGAGRTPLARAIYGSEPRDSGEVILEGKTLNIRKPTDAIRNGLLYLTEDRHGDGIFLLLSVLQNTLACTLQKYARLGFLGKGTSRRVTRKYADLLRIVTPSVNTLASDLSGGNQQKVLLSRILCAEPKILIADEPTRGVDVGVKSEIYDWLRRLADEGIGIIMISSELPEILGVTDRVLVMHKGELKGIVRTQDASEESLLALCYAQERTLETSRTSDEVVPV
jgi:ABC-type sugar transport system ATPase subunit